MEDFIFGVYNGYIEAMGGYRGHIEGVDKAPTW